MAEIVNADRIEDVSSFVPRNRSTFDLSYRFANTLRFGEYSPFFVVEGVNGDRIPFGGSHDLRSMNLKSPILSDIRIHKDYFMIPNEAILPLNWDKVITNPVIGDDVDAKFVNCVIPFSDVTCPALTSVFDELNANFLPVTSFADFQANLILAMKIAILFERFFSSGSLLSCLDYKLANALQALGFAIQYDDEEISLEYIADSIPSVDSCLDSFFASWFDFCADHGAAAIMIDGYPYDLQDTSAIHRRYVLDKMRDTAQNWSFIWNWSSFDPSLADQDSVLTSFKTNVTIEDINLSRVLAYQLVCAHFYSNDKVDYIYSAELYRQNVYDCVYNYFNSSDPDWNFTMNGVHYRYDILSGKTFFEVFLRLVGDQILDDYFFDFWRLILGFNRSLRYVDYFSGSRTRPLAVGDINVAVSGGNVNAVDITKGIQRARFLNFVNRTGRRFEEYISKLGGTYVAPDYHNPFTLATTDFIVGNQENENSVFSESDSLANTASSVYRSNGGNYRFEVSLDRPCIILGIAYFDLPRYYKSLTERQNFHVDRFDMFNPFLQFVGDQTVHAHEYDMSVPNATPFGYQIRNMEYKTRVDRCAGAIANDLLPSWVYDNDGLIFNNHISPDFIRSNPIELDKFFSVLSNFALGSYFHFIVVFNNECKDASRPMAFQPQLL